MQSHFRSSLAFTPNIHLSNRYSSSTHTYIAHFSNRHPSPNPPLTSSILTHRLILCSPLLPLATTATTLHKLSSHSWHNSRITCLLPVLCYYHYLRQWRWKEEIRLLREILFFVFFLHFIPSLSVVLMRRHNGSDFPSFSRWLVEPWPYVWCYFFYGK